MIGYYGVPPREILNRFNSKDLIDLDVDYGYEEGSSLPKVYCRIIKNIINNAEHLSDVLSLIICSVGEEKCDGGRFAAEILKSRGFNVLETRNNSKVKVREPIISESNLPLREKILKIMDTVHTDPLVFPQRCKPSFGFWGVPPSDLTLLDVFPDDTHVSG